MVVQTAVSVRLSERDRSLLETGVKETSMRLSLPGALFLALLANLLPGCDRTATDAEESAAARGGTSPANDDRKAAAPAPSKQY